MKIQQGDVVLHELTEEALEGIIANNENANRSGGFRGGRNRVNPTKLVSRTGSQALTLALGEVTGHHHTAILDHELTEEGATAEILDLGDRIFFRVLGGNVAVVHQEHDVIVCPPGLYERRITREQDHMTGLATGTNVVRFVAD